MSQTIEQEQKTIARDLRLRGAARPIARVSRKALIIAFGRLAAMRLGSLLP